ISSLISGKQLHFFPKPPRELNSAIPIELEKFLLNFLSKNPEERFANAGLIIQFINSIQLKRFSYSQEWGIVNNLKFNSYIVRNNYSHQLMNYIPSIKDGNGKTVAIIGNKGLGKNNLLYLFKYHLLDGSVYLFDYSCGPQTLHPFYALIKEFHDFKSMSDKEFSKDLENISTNFEEYLYKANETVETRYKSVVDLRADFESAKNYVVHLSEDKPLIFIIRNCQSLTPETIDFINTLSVDIREQRIFLVLSFSDFTKVGMLKNGALIKVQPLTIKETSDYIEKLVKIKPPVSFVEDIWNRCAGNPGMIRDMLIALTEQGHILKKGQFNFEYKVAQYKMSKELLKPIYGRLSHLKKENYNFLKSLSAIETPITNKLIEFVLGIDEKKVFFLINDAVNNDILFKSHDSYRFTFHEAKTKLLKEISTPKRVAISKKVVEYYENVDTNEPKVCLGVIENSRVAGDLLCMRKYLLRLYSRYDAEYEQEKSFREIVRVLDIDFKLGAKLPSHLFMSDLVLLVNKITVSADVAEVYELLPQFMKLPEIFNKYLVISMIYFNSEEYIKAIDNLNLAQELVVTGRQMGLVNIILSHANARLGNISASIKYLEELEGYQLDIPLKIYYADRKSVNLNFASKYREAVEILENCYENLPPIHDTVAFFRLASLHNNLGIFYERLHIMDEAFDHLSQARSILETYKIKTLLGLVYNNIGDIYLRQGDIDKAIEFFNKALDNAEKRGNKMTQTQAMLNLGESHLKRGDFIAAAKSLKRAKDFSEETENRLFYDSIMANIALLKSKTAHLSDFLGFLKELNPNLMIGKIEAIDPAVKTHFYYLARTGQANKILPIIKKNAHIDFNKSSNQEFYYNLISMIDEGNGDYESAQENLKSALRYVSKSNNFYATTIFYCNMARLYIKTGDFLQAKELLLKARTHCEEFGYEYWLLSIEISEAKLALRTHDKSLRVVLRQLREWYHIAKDKSYVMLELNILALIVQIYLYLKAAKNANQYFRLLKTKLEIVIEGDEGPAVAFLKKKFFYNKKDISEFNFLKIAPRKEIDKDLLVEQLYDLLRLSNTTRIKFFVEKALSETISPHQFAIYLIDNNSNLSSFMEYNCTEMISQSSKIPDNIYQSILNNEILKVNIKGVHFLFVPLMIKSAKIGCLVISDKSELSYYKDELALMEVLKLHLTAILVRVQEYTEMKQNRDLISKLMSASHEMMGIIDVWKLNLSLLSWCIDFTGSSRGFFLKKSFDGSLEIEIALDASKKFLNSNDMVSNSVLSDVQARKKHYFHHVSQKDRKKSLTAEIDEFVVQSVYAAPILLKNNEMYGIIYLDNYLDSSTKLTVNLEMMKLLLMQISAAAQNALQYQSLVARNIQLGNLEKAKDCFAGIVSHELITPLTKLNSAISRLKNKIYYTSEEMDNLLEKASGNTEHLTRTTESIMTFHRYNIVDKLRYSQIDLYEFGKKVKDEAESISKDRKMIIKFTIEENLPKLYFNWEAIFKAIHNILHNSIRYTKDFGSVEIVIRRSSFQTEKINDQQSIVFIIRDNGKGMPQYEIDRIFTKFSELKDLYSHHSGTIEYDSCGLGLGLSVTKRIIDLHHGKIWIKSEESEGTVVNIALPMIKEMDQEDTNG
ncbi:MAG: tetratricopeptide repeat protein, partial [Candidatus Zophobacter franzmannii]|nr:tetratricopeptide repeat protein [Candidatus Zophobacter franzmannii]